jgi:hypothetical protein
MKALKEVLFNKLNPETSYIYYTEEYERYGGGDGEFNSATGQEIIDELCWRYGFEEWKDDQPKGKATLKHFLKEAVDMNGDCEDYVLVFELPTIK